MGGQVAPLPGGHRVLLAAVRPPRANLGPVCVLAGQELVIEVVPGRLQAALAVGGRLVGARPGQVAGIQATADRLAHFVARQAGPHGPEEEFVIVEWVHGVTGRETSWRNNGSWVELFLGRKGKV